MSEGVCEPAGVRISWKVLRGDPQACPSGRPVEGPWRPLWTLRIGDFRGIFWWDGHEVRFIRLGSRGRVYQRLPQWCDSDREMPEGASPGRNRRPECRRRELLNSHTPTPGAGPPFGGRSVPSTGTDSRGRPLRSEMIPEGPYLGSNPNWSSIEAVSQLVWIR